MRKLLTDSFCKAQKPPAEGRLEFTDLRCAGLTYRITANGARSWAFRFKSPATGAALRATIGAFPDIGLSAARAAADRLRAEVAEGTNPIERKRVKRASATERSFAAVAERFMAEHSRRHKRSSDGDDRNLNLHILPRWRSRQIEDIRRADVIALAEELIREGKPVLANRVQALISSIFSFALDNEIVAANPCARLKKRGEEGVGTRVLTDQEIRLFWKRSVLSPVSRGTGLALRLQLVTGARPSEAAEPALAEFSSLEDPEKAAWLIPGARTKNKLDHLIPLSGLALQTVQSGLEMVDEDAKFLFPSPVNKDSAIDGHALAVAMRRVAESDKLTGAGSNTWKAEPPTPHDLRRTFSTRLSSLGVPKEDRDACMNHIPTDVGSKHYDLYERAKEKRATVELWAAELNRILGRPSS
ncbi:site-specific integrase [Bradyrhizobium sp. URHD0069]|uniref:tyrosine-type recombinase/integrase n=1 Tax=Bradyrhizobium sp. URHD0069 TaxID=1380355 RepID=UPI0012DCEE0B|nr:site-specific integrase [Bradyrhizobium sp. URHD0069]